MFSWEQMVYKYRTLSITPRGLRKVLRDAICEYEQYGDKRILFIAYQRLCDWNPALRWRYSETELKLIRQEVSVVHGVQLPLGRINICLN